LSFPHLAALRLSLARSRTCVRSLARSATRLASRGKSCAKDFGHARR